MNYLSLFSGVGGFELGINKAFQREAGVQPERQVDVLQPRGDSTDSDISLRNGRRTRPICIGFSEIDKYAIQTYEKNWGKYEGEGNQAGGEQSGKEWQHQRHNVHTESQRSETHYQAEKGHRNYGDVTAIDERNLPDFELLVGGFPCQAFSVAGKRRGFNDTRGTLFFDIARILAHKRPRHLVLENVKGLLSHDGGKTIQTIAGILTDLGYRIEWQVLNAKDFGVPQNRERIFIVGHLGGECAGQVFPITGNGGQDIKRIGHTPGFRRYHQTYDSSGAIESLDTSGGGGHQPCVAPTLRATDYKNGDTQTVVATRQPLRFLDRNQKNIEGDYAFTVDASQTSGVAIHPTIDANYYKGQSNQRKAMLQGTRIRRLTPTECERLMSWPDGWTIGSDTQRYKQCGNGVVSNVVQAVIEEMMEIKCL
jgi:DNA (cytosine-5)-methyltransferase 1